MSKTARIVLVEDDPHILQLLQHVLSMDGYEVIAAKDGEEGLAAVKQVKPALLITDVMMPRRNGYQLVHALLNEVHDVPTPKIIILTSRTDPADVKRGLTVGADVYIAKPFDIQEVTGHVRELLSAASA
jgi:DNA-binding response OmpR family regulator